MKTTRTVLIPLLAVCAGTVASAEMEDSKSKLSFDGGFDIRTRYDWVDNLPNGPGAVKDAAYSYYRVRSRLWGKASYGPFSVYGRLGNEFRGYDHHASKNEFPDELFVDNLYFEGKGLFDGLFDFRIGRQDMKFGAGRIISDGVGCDGSRAAYFDAIRLSVHPTEKTVGDFFGIWTRPTDTDLRFGQPEYYATSYSGQEYDTDMTEKGLGTYWTIKELEALPIDAYAVWKKESRWYKKGNHAQRVPGRQFTTIGARITPKLTEKLSAEAEAAYQFGETDDDRNSSAVLGYANLSWKEKDLYGKPKFGGAILYLSGDDKDSAYDNLAATDSVTGWTPVFNRCTYIGELPVKMYGSSYRWSNLVWPHAELTWAPFEGHKLFAQSGPMYAEKDDTGTDGSLYRGWYTFLAYSFPILKEIHNGRGAVTGKVQLEHMAYGGYYETVDAPDQSYFIRCELAMKF